MLRGKAPNTATDQIASSTPSRLTGTGGVLVNATLIRFLLAGGGALQASVSSQGPVLPSGGTKRTLPVLAADLHLEHLLVAFFVLIGRQVHA